MAGLELPALEHNLIALQRLALAKTVTLSSSCSNLSKDFSLDWLGGRIHIYMKLLLLFLVTLVGLGLPVQAQTPAPEGNSLPLRGAPAPAAPTGAQAGETMQNPGQMPGLSTSTQTMPDTSVPFNYARTPENPATPIEDSLKSPLNASQPASTPTQPAATGQKANLQGTANATTVSAVANLLSKSPLARCRDENLKFVQITIKNDSSQVALVHGDIAQANVGGVMKTATSARYVGSVAQPKLGLSGRIATGVAEVGTVGLAGPIVYENLTPDQHRKRYRGTAIGVDGSRHEIESERFGLRVLMPGDESIGWIAFECSDGKDPSNVVIPVNYSKSSLPSGSLIVSVGKAPATPPAPAASPAPSN
jgi:hypothetical protein